MTLLTGVLLLIGLSIGTQPDPSTGVGQADSLTVESDSTRTRGIRFLVLPTAFYGPETGVGAGIAGQTLFRTHPDRRPSNMFAVLTVTQKRQVIAEMMPELYLSGTRLFAKAIYNRWPDTFYGVGDNLPEDQAESYGSSFFILHLEAQRTVRSGVRLGFQYDLRTDRVYEREPFGLLESGEIPGSENARTSGPGIVLDIDSRENIFAARGGHWVRLSGQFLHRIFGSRNNAGKYTLDARLYRSILPDHVVAVQLYGSTTFGTVPFQLLPQLGGPRLLRGYVSTRYRDNHSLILQGEYRTPFILRTGLVLFGGVGDLAAHPSKFSLKDVKSNVGVGLRFQLSPAERLHLRIDYGLGLRDDTAKLYITVNEAI